MAEEEPSAGSAPDARYCAVCGEVFSDTQGDRCPRCGTPWRPQTFTTVAAVATLLTELRWLREDGLLDEASYEAARSIYERRLAGARPAQLRAEPGESATAQPGEAATRARRPGLLQRILDPASSGAAVVIPPRLAPPGPPRQTLGEWAAARQADILLYLGAFLLSIAALIFVGYQGKALTGEVRFLVLVVYTVAFLALGLVLPRWERVREAGPVFLALGALLVPVNVIALRTQVLGAGTLPDDVLWLLGGTLTAALYLTLASRGYGRLYALPGALAVVVAWGALRSALGVPDDWFGGWFTTGAGAVLLVAAWRPLPGGDWVRRGAVLVAGFGLLAAHLIVLDGADVQLAVAYAVLLPACVAWVRRQPVGSLALLPPMAAMTALAGWRAAFGLETAWWGVFIAGAGIGYLGASVYDEGARERRWEAAAGLSGALALFVCHAALAGYETDIPAVARASLPAVYAIVLGGCVWLYARRHRLEALAVLPALAAALGGATTWAVLQHHSLWFAPWVAAAGLGYLALAEQAQERRVGALAERDCWRLAAAFAGALAIVLAYGSPGEAGAPVWHLPLTYLLVTAGAAWETYRRRAEGTLALPVLAALLGVSVLQAAGTPAVWWSYPCLGAVLAALAAEPWWRRRPVLADLGWPETLAGAVAVPLVFTALYADHPAHGVVGYGVAAGVFVVAALRCRGTLVRAVGREPTETALTLERQTLARAGGALLIAAAGYFNQALALTGSDRAWVFAGLGLAAWLGLALFGRRRELFGILAPGGVTALAIAAWLARDAPGVAALLLVAGAAGAASAFPSARRWWLWPIAAGFVVAALAFAWRWRNLDPALLPLAYAGGAVVLSAALAPVHRYERAERGLAIALLRWGIWAVALATAVVLMERRLDVLLDRESIVRTREWAVLAIVTAAAALALLGEGVRLRRRWLLVGGSAGLVVALELAIAIAQPENVQAYTLPLGLYLIGLGLTWRHTPEVIGPHLLAHEGVQITGMLVALLPAAAQSLEPGGGRFGLELIAAGLLLLAGGMALSARWLVVGGVLTLSAVGVRWLTVESAVPYWLTLGVVGMALLAVGTFILLERDRWDRARDRLRRWWAGGAA